MSSSDFGMETAEPMVGEVTALRSFRLTDDGYLLPLTEAGGYDPWPTTTSAAKCNRGKSHLAPDPDCTCGFYAYGNRGWVQGNGQYLWSQIILAAVHCSGRLVAGEKGLRAEKVRLVACYVNKHAPATVQERLREHYPDVEFHQSRKSLLTAHPETHLSTYVAPPRRVIRFNISAFQMVLAFLAIPFLIFTLWGALGSGDPMSASRLSMVIFAFIVWSPIIIEGFSLAALRMSPDTLSTLRRMSRLPWAMNRRAYLAASPIPRLTVMGMALGFLFTAPSGPLDAGWATMVISMMAVATLVVVWLELRKVLPFHKTFPLIPRAQAIHALAEKIAPSPGARDSLKWERVLTEDYAAEMYDMGGYGVGLIHFDIVSDPEDYPPAVGSAPDLTKGMKVMAAKMGLGDRWVAYIASEEDRLRVLSSTGDVSPPIPLADIDAILPIPNFAWCPPSVRPSYVASLLDGTFDAESHPHYLPVRYLERRGFQDAFSDPQIENALRIARRVTEQSAYRDFKRDQARLPEGLSPVAVPNLPSEEGGIIGKPGDETWAITQALVTLMDTAPEMSSARRLTFAMGELMDGLSALGGANEIVSLDSSGLDSMPPPSESEFGMRAAHLLLVGAAGMILNDSIMPISFTSPEGKVYAVLGVDKKIPQCATLTLRTAALERGRGDDGDALGDAHQ